MNVDVMRRAKQNILVNCDLFSGYVTAEIIESERKEDMVHGILSLVTPIRHSDRVLVRVDRAPALASLKQNPDAELDSNGITLDLGEHFNKNSNCSVDKKIQELESEIRRICPKETKLSFGELTKAVTSLNNRVRNQGLSAAQIHFSRDTIAGHNLRIDDKKIFEEKLKKRKENHPISSKSKSTSGKQHIPANVSPGQLVYVRDALSKHEARNPLLVTGVQGTKINAKKVLHSHDNSMKNPKITSEEITVDEKFLYVPPHRRKTANLGKGSSSDSWWRKPQQMKTPEVLSSWTPTHRPANDEDCYVDLPPSPEKLVHSDTDSGTEESDGDGSDDGNEHFGDRSEEPDVGEKGEEDDSIGKVDDQAEEEQSEGDDDAGGGPDDHVEDTSEDDEVIVHTFNQNSTPRKGDLIICYNDRDNRWMIVRLTSDRIKYYKDYYNYLCVTTGEEGGQYLRRQGHWGYIDEAQAKNINLDLMDAPIAEIDQVDGGITPDSLSPEGSFVDDDYSDQESVFGNCEMEYFAKSLEGKSNRTHADHLSGSEYDRDAHLSRISQTMNLELRPMTIEVEQYTEFPSAASFPVNDVEIPCYHYHLGRGRVLSISSPELREERISEATWLGRMANWRKRWRKRSE